MTDQERDDELAEDSLWRARKGFPMPLEDDARRIIESNPKLAEELGLTELAAEVEAARESGSPARYLAERERERTGAPELADTPTAALDDLRAAIAAGEPCTRLYEITRAMGPKSPDRQAANEALRQVGCLSPQSSRTDR